MSQETICLITPPSIFLLDERVYLSLGILKVAATLEARGYRIEALDFSGIENYVDAMVEHAKTTKAKVFGITATSPQMPATKRIVEAIRGARPDSKVIIGGPHPTLVCAAAKKEKHEPWFPQKPGRAKIALYQLLALADVVVTGDGEDAVFQALAMERGVVDGDDPKGLLFLTSKRLEETPFPARHLADMDSYHATIDGMKSTSLIAQLGCPFACGFCAGRTSPMLRRIRTRSTESVLRELEMLYTKYGFRAAMMYDDEMNVNKSVVELMNGIADLGKRLGVDWRLRGFVKAELFTDEQAEAMYRAGFRVLLCGYESGSPRILENINKKATREDNDRCVEIAHRAGIKVKALMSIGHPGESRETIKDTEEWLLKVKPDDFDVTIITPYPGSPYFDDAVETSPGVWTYTCAKSGDRLHADAIDYMETADFYKGQLGAYVSHVFTDYISKEELVAERDAVEARVREALGIPYNAGAPGIQFEASMGMTKLPPTILRSTSDLRNGEERE